MTTRASSRKEETQTLLKMQMVNQAKWHQEDSQAQVRATKREET